MVKGVTVESIRCCISRSYPSPYISPAFFRVASSCEDVSKKGRWGHQEVFSTILFCSRSPVMECCLEQVLAPSFRALDLPGAPAPLSPAFPIASPFRDSALLCSVLQTRVEWLPKVVQMSWLCDTRSPDERSRVPIKLHTRCSFEAHPYQYRSDMLCMVTMGRNHSMESRSVDSTINAQPHPLPI